MVSWWRLSSWEAFDSALIPRGGIEQGEGEEGAPIPIFSKLFPVASLFHNFLQFYSLLDTSLNIISKAILPTSIDIVMPGCQNTWIISDICLFVDTSTIFS